MALHFRPTEIAIGGVLSNDASLQSQFDAGALVVDSHRRRPYYFDGRLLTAADLTADQDYHRERQADLGRAIGAGTGGIVRGLGVRLGREAASGAPTLVVEAGLGLTPGGDIVQVADTLELPVASLSRTQALDLQMGVKQVAAASGRLTGLFVLALRPAEFAANPVASYPTTLDGERTVRNGDIVEATILTLIPYPDRSGTETASAKRARAAREVFVDGRRAGVPQDALPLAMLCLDGGALQWLDVYLVRREVGSESTLAAGLAPRPRALLEAWFAQHLDALDDVDDDAFRAGFPAASRFEVLPPIGPLPAACLRFGEVLGAPALLQSWLPPQVDCEFAFIPSDELAALVQESLALPPIDLQAGDAALDRLSVLVLAPVTRQQLEAFKRELGTLTRPVRAAAAGLVAKRSPLEAMLRISLPRDVLGTAVVPGPEPDSLVKAWQRAFAQTLQQASQASTGGFNRPVFWYLRRRQLPHTTEVSGVTLRLAGDAAELDKRVDDAAAIDKTVTALGQVRKVLPALGVAEVTNLLGAPRLALSKDFDGKLYATSDLLRRSATLALVQRQEAKTLDHAAVLAVARDFGDPRLGEGLDALAEAADEDTRQALRGKEVNEAIATTGLAPALDQAARVLSTDKLAGFASGVVKAAQSGDPQKALAELAGSVSG